MLNRTERLVIVTPIWKESLDPEELALMKITDHENSDIEKFFICPLALDTRFYEENFPNWRFKFFEKRFFKSVNSYNQLMLRSLVYKSFSDYELMVLCQTDACLVKNIRLLDFKDFDYVGAPWDELIYCNIGRVYGFKYLWRFFEKGQPIRVGNGGLSIRRISTFVQVCDKLKFKFLININEDAFFSYLGSRKKIAVPDFVIAKEVFLESTLAHYESLPAVYGFHAIRKWNTNLADQLLRKYRYLLSCLEGQL